jgi:hypothetical protein
VPSDIGLISVTTQERFSRVVSRGGRPRIIDAIIQPLTDVRAMNESTTKDINKSIKMIDDNICKDKNKDGKPSVNVDDESQDKNED